MRALSWIGLLLLLSLVLSSCKLELDDDLIPPMEEKNIEDLDIPEDFDFNTTHTIQVNLLITDGADKAMTGVPVSAYHQPELNDEFFVLNGFSDSVGRADFIITVPKDQEYIYFYTPYMGLINWMKIPAELDNITLTWGEEGYVYDYDAGRQEERRGISNRTTFDYTGDYDFNGVPDYLVNSDLVDGDLLTIINNSLPEGFPVPDFNPQYISEDIITDIRLQERADVWVTFVHEGAGYRNALGYYTYDLDSPPATKDDIQNLNIIFPNVSYAGGGGDLRTGYKVLLGTFEANTGIGWFLVPDGWSYGSQSVSEKSGSLTHLKFSNRDFNTFTNAANRSHLALLKDDEREIFILGFEDQSRPGGDKDFNDAIFYTTVSPYEAVIQDNVAEVRTESIDSDNDGVPDIYDDFPDDPKAVSSQFLPAKGSFSTLAYEDLWPSQGDYDFNDLVLDYNLEYRMDKSNQVWEMIGVFKLKAMGAGFRNGFAFELGTQAGDVASVEGNDLSGNKVTVSSNGTEAGQQNAVIVVFDNWYTVMPSPPGQFVNTQLDAPYVDPVTLTVRVVFNKKRPMSVLSGNKFNPFLFAGRGRGYEVHLPGFAPTDLANQSLFGTEDDNGLAGNNYYKTNSGLPWAIQLPNSFAYPIEGIQVIKAHKKFADWAESGGNVYSNWYTNQSGYRESSLIYNK